MAEATDRAPEERKSRRCVAFQDESLKGGVKVSWLLIKWLLPESSRTRGQWQQEHGAPTQEPRNFSGILPQFLVLLNQP